jgi:phosphoenolpyruvate synthase/pyruvate phosphate dikinase
MPVPTMHNTIPLAELTRDDVQLAGGKAANLGELMRAGFSVPDGFAIIGEPDETAVRSATERLGDVPLAVRSSAVAEDLADSSFAGQCETVLGAQGPDGHGEGRQDRRPAGSSRCLPLPRQARRPVDDHG